MNENLLERYYESVVLPLYDDDIDVADITWKDHGQVGPDAWAHYFDDRDGREYVLLYEDFPGSDYLNDDLTHEILPCGEEASVRVMTVPERTIDNFTGYFTLYGEKRA